MRQLQIDELSREELDNIDNYLKRNAVTAPIGGMFWLNLPAELLAEAQQGHDKCGPFYFGVELGRDNVNFELLLRSQSNLHCTCISYATKEQRQFVLDFVDKMLAEEKIQA